MGIRFPWEISMKMLSMEIPMGKSHGQASMESISMEIPHGKREKKREFSSQAEEGTIGEEKTNISHAFKTPEGSADSCTLRLRWRNAQ